MCKVSIVIPVYNVEKYLRQCMESVIRQTLRDIEIICVNDGSTDSSPEILREYAAADPRIRIIDKPNTGYGHTMNVGMQTAKGKYIGFVESDDFVAEDMFESLYNAIEEQGAEVVKSDFFRYFHEGCIVRDGMLSRYPDRQVFSPREEGKVFLGGLYLWTSLYRRDFLAANGIWFHETPGASYQDTSFSLKVLSCAKQIYAMPDACFYYYRDNPEASVHSRGKPYCMREEYEEVWRFLHQDGERLNAFCRVIPQVQYNSCIGDCRRTDSRFWVGVLNCVADDFRGLRDKGFLEESHWEAETWKGVQWLLQDTGGFIFDHASRWQQQYLLVSAFLRQLERCRKIYIYGAGQVGVSTWKRIRSIRKFCDAMDCFLVTRLEDAGGTILGIPVRALAEVEPEEDSVVLIAVKDSDQYPVMQALHDRGVWNTILMDRRMRDILYAMMPEF